ncbi:site-specific DNA-methyltransferase [Streptococcus sp. SS-4456]|uniref:site-specific DNA-methyltransferase n=1 Tax=Streptococcus sp. SS-4456 TaxID=3072286 RepID=UPI002FCB742A
MPKDFNELPHQNEKNEALDYVRDLIDQARIDGRNEDVVQLDKIIKLLNRKKYGLVWEEHAELVEEEMKTRIPVFIEDETRKIRANPEDKDYNFLLEGDNLHSLHLLEKTHAGRIDVIYIDPPYNTGNKDFKYNDRFVDKTDGYAHSKWLSFMSKRLEIARKLLSDSGVIFISIDDNEQAQLKLLCDEVFGNRNFIAELPTIMNLKGNQDEFGFAGTHEYTVCYSKNKSLANIREFITSESELDRWMEDEIGFYKKGATLKRTGADAPRESRPTSYYPILVKDNAVYSIQPDEHARIYDRFSKRFDDDFVSALIEQYGKDGFEVLLPEANGEKTSWRWQYSKVKEESDEIIVVSGRLGSTLYKKQRPQLGDLPTKKPKTIFYKPEYSSGNGTKQLKEIFGKKVFNNPKPLELIKDFIYISTHTNALILDFFAGSGTTGHAVAQLNKEDGGNRKYILCTNNENNICEEVTYKRLTNIQDDLPHNLKYFKTKFLSKDDEELEFSLLHHVHTLIELEHGIDLKESDKATAFSLSDLRKLDLSGIKTVYVRQQSHAMMEKSDLVRFEGIELIDVPEYYFAKEMREAGL